ncbi:MAG: hypothetical protein JSS51_14340 [Planctomycetes bacterium]|nr:hypothetical protein [Planctomycetota bacterium]
MPRRLERLLRASWLIAASAALGAPAPDRSVLDDTLDSYLKQRGMTQMRLYELEKRLAGSNGNERTKLLTELASTYESLLESLPTDQRATLREKSRALLKDNPRPELAALRINLLKAEYLQAEQVAERARVGLATEKDSNEAIASLKRLAVEFNEIAQAAAAKVRTLESTDQARQDLSFAEEQEAKAQLQDARRVKSLAHYYAGWSQCYLAQLTKDRAAAGDALLHFGVLLNAPDRKAPSLERLPRSLLVHEHVARACLGTATCFALLGNDAEALRWLEELSTADSLPDPVRMQLFSRRVAILGPSSRWSELSAWVQRTRAPQGKVVSPLDPADAVLLAVTALENPDGPEAGGAKTRTELGRIALADLIARGQIAPVVTLSRRYGTGALASEGFIAQYVRALEAFDDARAKHRALGKADDPVGDSAVGRAYRAAAALFEVAARADDASSFEVDAAKASLNAGMALFYASDFLPAAEQFARLASRTKNEDVRRDAMWFEVVALDRAIASGRTDVSIRRDEASILFITTFPRTELAARLLLKRAGLGKFSDAEIAETLLSVPESSPLRHEARVQACTMLFKVARAAPAASRDEAIRRFLLVSDEVFPAERDAAVSAGGAQRATRSQRALLLGRQQLEAALTLSVPDTVRAERMLAEIEKIGELSGQPLETIADELAYRSVQIALAKGNPAQAEDALDSVGDSQSAFAQAARLLFLRHAIDQWRQSPLSLDAARSVAAKGRAAVEAIDRSQQFDARANSLRDEVAGAAGFVFAQTGDSSMRELAMRIDRGMYERGGRFTSSLKRLAEMSEATGDKGLALECWRLLASGLPQGQPSWFDATYKAIELQSQSDIAGARDAFRLFETSWPDFGPSGGRKRFEALRDRLFPTLPPGGGQ